MAAVHIHANMVNVMKDYKILLNDNLRNNLGRDAILS